MVVTEAALVVDRLDRQEATRALLVHMAVSATPSLGADAESQKKLVKSFFDVINDLMGT